jgi:hypothetical protein
VGRSSITTVQPSALRVVVTVRTPSLAVEVAEAVPWSAPDREEALTDELDDVEPELFAETEEPAEPFGRAAFGRDGGVTVLDPSADIRTISQSSGRTSWAAALRCEPAPRTRATATMGMGKLRISTPRMAEVRPAGG